MILNVIGSAPALALSGALIAAGLVAAPPAFAQGNKCTEEAASIRRAESQLPRLEVAPPGDQQIVCITLETNMLFARRLAAHLDAMSALAARPQRGRLAADRLAIRRAVRRAALQAGDPRLSRIELSARPPALYSNP